MRRSTRVLPSITFVLLLILLNSPFALADLSEPPGGQISGDVFEKEGGWLHGFIKLTNQYSDNIFNSPDNKVDDFSTIITPGIWVALPGNKERIVEIYTSNVAPGGFMVGRPRPDRLRQYQTYLFYQPEFEVFWDNSDENTDRHLLEGMAQYNFRGGLTLDLIGQFRADHDGRSTGVSAPEELDKFKTYFLNPLVDWELTEKIGLRADYNYFIVEYDEDRNAFRDRTDNQVGAQIYFNMTEKMSLTAQYQFIDVAYDITDNSISDSTMNRGLIGIEWNVTEKTSGRLGGGYSRRDFEQDIDTAENFEVEGQVFYDFTEKLSLELGAVQRATETDVPGTDYIMSTVFNFGTDYQVTERFSLGLTASFVRDDYQGPLSIGGVTQNRKDDSFGISPSLAYQFTDWFFLELEYRFSDRDSNFDVFDYQTNQVSLALTGGL